MAEGTPTQEQQGGLTRRGFVVRAAAVAAGIAGLSLLLRRRSAGQRDAPAPLQLDEDSIFTPRADQRDRVLGRK